MRKSKFSEHQIIAILKAVEAGRTVRDVCREHEISDATYYQWNSKYGGIKPQISSDCVNSAGGRQEKVANIVPYGPPTPFN